MQSYNRVKMDVLTGSHTLLTRGNYIAGVYYKAVLVTYY